MDILELLQRLEELIEQATRVPLTGRVLLDPDQVLTLLDEMREVLPEQVRAATRLTADRGRIMDEARAEAEAVVREAKVYAAQLADETAVAREATIKAEEMIEQAKRVAREIRTGALDFAKDLLGRVESNLEKAYEMVRSGRDELNG